MEEPQVTIVVSPRERFSYTRESLESIYEHTQIPFKLVYVDGGSPAETRRYLETQALEKNFQLIRTNCYLSPNQARNLGLQKVDTKYVAFIDNDVAVTAGWLKQLVQCAEETGATIVGPLTCQGTPIHEIVHCAGGESGIRIETEGEHVRRRMIEKIYKQGRKVADLRDQFKRQETGLAEFHCMLVRTELFDQIGLLDEGLLNTKEHVDLCITVVQNGGTVYFEPSSLVTYVPGPPLKWSDIPFYMLRWSDAWELASLKHLREKWNLTEDDYFKNKYKKLGWRRKVSIVKPLANNLIPGRLGQRFAEKVLVGVDKQLNRYVTTRYTKQQVKFKREQVSAPQPQVSVTSSQS